MLMKECKNVIKITY